MILAFVLAGCAGSDPAWRDRAGCELARHVDVLADGRIDEGEHLRFDDSEREIERLTFEGPVQESLSVAFDEAGCRAEVVRRTDDAWGRFEVERTTSECDSAENPDRSWITNESGLVPLVDAASESRIRYENHYDGHRLTRVVARRFVGDRVRTTRRDYTHDAQGRVVREVVDEGQEVIETTWHDEGPFAERTTTLASGWEVRQRQEVDRHGRVTREERWEGGELRRATDRTWDAGRYAVRLELHDTDGDGAPDFRTDVACEGDPVVWCRHTSFGLGATRPALTLMDETWTCPGPSE